MHYHDTHPLSKFFGQRTRYIFLLVIIFLYGNFTWKIVMQPGPVVQKTISLNLGLSRKKILSIRLRMLEFCSH